MNGSDLARILDELGQRLGPTGQHVFDLAVRHVFIDAAIGIVFSLGVIAGFVWVARKTAQAARESGDLLDAPLGFPLAFGSIFTGIAAAGALLVLAYDLSRLLNPEYSALQDIIGAIVN